MRPDDPAAAAALAVLTDRRLVVARAEDVGIAHEALLTGWPRLHDWLEDGRSRADVRERLAVAATAWEEADQRSGRAVPRHPAAGRARPRRGHPGGPHPAGARLPHQVGRRSGPAARRTACPGRPGSPRPPPGPPGRRRARRHPRLRRLRRGLRGHPTAQSRTGSRHCRRRPAGGAGPGWRRLRPVSPPGRPGGAHWTRHPRPRATCSQHCFAATPCWPRCGPSTRCRPRHSLPTGVRSSPSPPPVRSSNGRRMAVVCRHSSSVGKNARPGRSGP